ncbi:hypothetical protein BDFB_010705 [Asbolus verrucosus]|uniref:Uncharacterized protein n=1 Tax=Asbolus verrucosus TaxID=1661398 RepID=A0A482W1Q2_ASBVE|nr:hypothetical protein BDFB_010705 [Asbolus verrucosus]
MSYLKSQYKLGDLIQMFGLHITCFLPMFRLREMIVSDHINMLPKECFKTSFKQRFLTNRVFDLWNGLSNETVSAETICIFKKRLNI